jgi:hypothetical protein
LQLRRYWITFDLAGHGGMAHRLQMGCGVTAHSLDEALELVRRKVLRGEPLPPVATVQENVDVSTLDADHILPNMGVCAWYGVWFPPVQ